MLARRILAYCGPGAEPIALLFDNGAEVSAAILSVLKAGKFYVLLDPSYPAERLRHLLADSEARLIVADSRALALARTLSHEGGNLLVFDSGADDVADTNVDLRVSPDALALIIYTSGSTGRPKGVMHTHRTVLADVRHQTALGVGAGDRSAWHTSGGFAGSVRTMWGALLNGAALHPFDTRRQGFAQLAAWLQRHQITIFRTVPTTFRTFMATLSDGLVFPSVRMVSMGGEPLFRADVESFNRHFPPHCVLVHPFGPTECMLVCWNVIAHGAQIAGPKVPIGRTLPDVTVLLLDDAGRPTPDGEIGEIVVKSRYLSPGYWRDPARTDAVFQRDEPDSDERIYLTGDLGTRSSDGTLTHQGRRDFQLKIRGFRIEVSEIETALRDVDGIDDVVVVGQPSDHGEVRLTAYFVASRRPALTVSALRGALAQTLPDYMIPSVFVAMDALPQTPTGKTDRAHLPSIDGVRPPLAVPLTPARTSVEQVLARVWAEVLGVNSLGIHDDFFELGGDSLVAMRLTVRIKKLFDVDLPPTVLFDRGTIAETAAAIEHVRRQAQRET